MLTFSLRQLRPHRMPRLVLAISAAAALLLWGCGGPAPATPTAIPAGIVRPVQPTPQYPGGADVFALLTPQASPQFVAAPAAEDAPAETDAGASPAAGMSAAVELLIKNQTPSAMGIAPGGAAIYAERGGRALASVPSGGVLTVTGKSADGSWYAVYNDDAVFGWTPAGQLRVYGGEDLVVVEEAPDPAPVATLLAQTAAPVRVLDDLLAQFDAAATAAVRLPAPALAAEPMAESATAPAADLAAAVTTEADRSAPPAEAATPFPAATGEPAAAAVTAVVSSDGRLNLRAEPNTGAAIVQKLDPGTPVTLLERSADGAWLRVQLADGMSGWVAAEFVTLAR